METSGQQNTVTQPQVCCQVHSCVHNTAGCCTAKEIRVGPQFASCQAETLCATFKLQ